MRNVRAHMGPFLNRCERAPLHGCVMEMYDNINFSFLCLRSPYLASPAALPHQAPARAQHVDVSRLISPIVARSEPFWHSSVGSDTAGDGKYPLEPPSETLGGGTALTMPTSLRTR